MQGLTLHSTDERSQTPLERNIELHTVLRYRRFDRHPCWSVQQCADMSMSRSVIRGLSCSVIQSPVRHKTLLVADQSLLHHSPDLILCARLVPKTQFVDDPLEHFDWSFACI